MTNTEQLQSEYHAALQRVRALRDRLAEQGLVEKSPVYAGLYVQATRELQASRDRQALAVLVELANHADELGFSYPGDKRLGELTGYATTSVQAAISRLMAKDWLRVHITVQTRRKTVQRDFQLSPCVLYIREGLQPLAWEAYNETPWHSDLNELHDFVTKHVQPESVTRKKPVSQPATLTSTPTSSSSTPEYAKADGNDGNAPTKTKTKTKDSAKRNPPQAPIGANEQETTVSSTEAPPSSAPPPHAPLPSGVDLRKPLPSGANESAAQRVQAMMPNLTIANARKYITLYGIPKAMIAADFASTRQGARNPVGLMDFTLRQSVDESLDGWRLRLMEQGYIPNQAGEIEDIGW